MSTPGPLEWVFGPTGIVPVTQLSSSGVMYVYITTRDYATQYAALAQVLETIDEGTEQVLLDSRLATSSIGLIEPVFGKTVNTGNVGYDLDVYRQVLVELRTAYRYYGGTVDGMSRVVRSFTQISPLILPFGFGPAWILGKDFINPSAAVHNTYYTTSTLPVINAGGADVFIADISDTVGIGAGLLTYGASPSRLSWTPPGGSIGPAVEITGNGEYTLYGGDYFDDIMGECGPYNIVSGVNDILSLNIDNHGVIDITLTAGPARTPSEVATDINNALVADSRYGIGFSTTASSYGAVSLLKLTAVNSIGILIHSGPDAAPVLFNISESYVREAVANYKPITVSVSNYAVLPGAPCSDSFIISGTGVPDGWIATSSLSAPEHQYFSLDRDIPFDLESGDSVLVPVSKDILKYRGCDANVIVWGKTSDPSVISPSSISSIDVSFDDGGTWATYPTSPVGICINAENKPQEWVVTTRIPVSITKMWFRVNMASSGSGRFTIHKARVTVSPVWGGLYLGEGTTPRDESTIKQGKLLYYWGINPIVDAEKSALGVVDTASTMPGYSDQSAPGHIDNIAPAASSLFKYDVSEYDMSSVAKNIKGAFTDADFSAGISVNLSLVPSATTPRFSYLAPIVTNDISQTVVFVATSTPFKAPLGIKSDQDISKSILTQNGLPLTQDMWHYNSSLEIELATGVSLDTTSTYVLNYNALIQFESAPIDLGPTYTDYMWFTDYDVWLRPEIRPLQVLTTAGVQFDTMGKGALAERSIMDTATSTLVEDLGLSKRIIPSSQWQYLDANTVQINANVFTANGLYELTYMAEMNHPSISATAVVELRSATSIIDLVSATYVTVSHNTPIDQYRYHQMRVTVSNTRDLRDARINSLVLKGLNAFGAGGHIPVLRKGV